MTASLLIDRRELPYAREPQRQAQRGGEVTMQAPENVAVLQVRGQEVARYVWQAELPLSSSPRPYLHPVRTLGGLTVTDAAPDSHTHQFGISVAFPDVDGTNFWGGRTFVAGHGPAWLDNHGRQRHGRWMRRNDSGLEHTLSWIGADGSPLLHERRAIACRPVNDLAWALAIRTQLTNATDRPLTVSSPVAKGRVGAGYGGFFWRGPAASGAAVLSPAGTGVENAHGRTAPWVAVTDGSWSVLFLPGDEVTARDKWFVRARDYLGVCSSVTWEEPLVLEAGESVSRHVVTVVIDGGINPEVAAELARLAP